MGGLFSPPGFSAYAATKHALEAIAEAMQEELRPFGIQVQTINPGAYLTGFNEAMAENAFRGLDDAINFTKRDMTRDMANGLIGNEQGRLDPSDMIAKDGRSHPLKRRQVPQHSSQGGRGLAEEPPGHNVSAQDLGNVACLQSPYPPLSALRL
jgi:NAD(P)-dependent dehydrogenase (short-subunit alcohol dehydrogenase family)